jgi:thiol-disulfide isomerase/thioredoxin
MLHALIASSLTALALGPDLKTDGAFGFPQKQATVLCDTPELRLSAFSDAGYLYVQAVVWKDGDSTKGETDDGREIGDNSTLRIDADADKKITPKVDRSYSLDPWPALAGLHYSVELGEGSSTGLQRDSKGRGAVSYVDAEGAKVRVDSFLIPLQEINRKAGETVRVAYYGKSMKPDLLVNSVGFVREGKPYYSHHLPLDKFHDLPLADRPAVIDVQQVPEGRGTIAVKAKASAPKVGEAPPPVAAQAWLNWKGKEPPSLESLRGKVVVVEFWATWCGPCVAGIPHLNELQAKHEKEGLVILSLTDQSKPHVEEFAAKREMKYTIGVKSETGDAYGVSGIPHAFIVGRDGKLRWAGHPAEKEFDTQVAAALAVQQ